MSIHKEGYKTIGIAAMIFGIVNLLSFTFLSGPIPWLALLIFIFTLVVLIFLILFFRSPKREFYIHESQIISPADGRVVVIEEVTDKEYFKDRRIQLSIFMSPTNVHINRNPVDGIVTYSQYHSGKYWVAWHPKSSAENECHSVVVKNENGEIMIKQIAGALARRISNYCKVGKHIKQSEIMGFIKFGSRVDVLLPLNATVHVHLNQLVKGGVTVLATW
ncbi:MAG: phosphatidylserine decarboxylase family protein [Chitinophagaceae bacterium]